MRIVRFKQELDAPATWGWVSGDRIGVLVGSPFSEFKREEAALPLEEAILEPPVLPSKILCVGRNYSAHAAEHQAEVPKLPLFFMKPPSALIGHGTAIQLPPQSEQVEHEAELAVVIGRGGRWIEPEKVADHLLGYTIANDVTARDLQRADGQWTRGKGFDTFCPIGPWIETVLDPSDQLITCKVNGQLRQMASTRDMVFSVRRLVAFISAVMTLFPGDILLTGTPAGVGPLVEGDRISIEIEGIGILENPVEKSVADQKRS
jgi:2-keto-4-pentenoate hydratase/2-oxohepta-3-ene-1,7-dioic acid hydratase in catechol pathway